MSTTSPVLIDALIAAQQITLGDDLRGLFLAFRRIRAQTV
jgi:hypothetical protein